MLLSILPPTDITAVDKPNDAGATILLNWRLSDDDVSLDGYTIFRRLSPDSIYEKIGTTIRAVSFFEDEGVQDGKEYQYVVAAVKNGELFRSEPSNISISSPQVFHTGRINVLVSLLTFTTMLA
jgi:hypothetical protein